MKQTFLVALLGAALASARELKKLKYNKGVGANFFESDEKVFDDSFDFFDQMKAKKEEPSSIKPEQNLPVDGYSMLTFDEPMVAQEPVVHEPSCDHHELQYTELNPYEELPYGGQDDYLPIEIPMGGHQDDYMGIEIPIGGPQDDYMGIEIPMNGHQDDFMGVEIPVGLPQQPMYENVDDLPFDDYSLPSSYTQPGFTTIDQQPLQP